MAFLPPTIRISLCLVCIALSVLFLSMALGLVPDYYASRLESRKVLCENLAINCSFAMQREDIQTAKDIVQAAMRRNSEILSAGLREAWQNGSSGILHVELGDHDKNWYPQVAPSEDPDYVGVPIFQGNRQWGTLELRFQPLQTSGLLGFVTHPLTRLYLFYSGVCTLAFYLFVRLLLRQLNFSQARVVPSRVKATLDTLAEGVIILNKGGQIVMANDAFAKTTGFAIADLEGQSVSDLAWSTPVGVKNSASPFPWEHSLMAKEAQTGVILNLEHDGQPNILAVNSMPVVGDDGAVRGALVSFDNLTPIEEKNTDLRRLLHKLKRSKVKLQKQKDDLQVLATRDHLTGCWNRRSFFEAFASHWAAHQKGGRTMSCIMFDIDHFKLINDNHGHSSGDRVLQEVSALLQKQIRQTDLICRYGGEEFCVLMPGHDLAGATQTAERLRQKVENLRPLNLPVTASLGVSSIDQGARTMQELLDQADKALYVAKRTGRNKVQCWDETAAEKVCDAKAKSRADKAAAEPQPSIPYPAVNVLLNTLNYRHSATAEHCRRVADLCIAASRGILNHNDSYVLEMAALLHDIGKLGVPDSILLKASALTPEERSIIKLHEDIGEELIAVAFSCQDLSAIIRGHHCLFGGDPENKSLPKGQEIPMPARILTIADAFDSMVTDQVYRKGRSQEEAFQELRRHAGIQFDPDLVEVVIQRIMERNQKRNHASSA